MPEGGATHAVSDAWDQRFAGLTRLVGVEGAQRLRDAVVMVVGLGGVGSWVAEGLARSGIGKLVLVDGDDVCLSNTNRQLHALDGQVGRGKSDAMAERMRLIHPGCQVLAKKVFLDAENVDTYLAEENLLVVDAIDTVSAKCALLAACRARGLRTICCGGAGGKVDGTRVKIDDLARSGGDALLRQVRKRLRRDHGFPSTQGADLGIRAVFSPEAPRFPWSDGSVREKTEPGTDVWLDCSKGFGTASFVTGVFGLAAAGELVKILVEEA